MEKKKAHIVSREQCPSCASQGKDEKGDNLNIYSDDGEHCFSCGYHKSPLNGEYSMTNSFELIDAISMPFSGIKSRGLNEKTCNKFGLKNKADKAKPNKPNPQTGEYEPARTSVIYFPYYDIDGRLIGSKGIDFSKAKLDDGRFFWQGDFSKATVFGSNLIGSIKNNLVICEGEIDAVSAAQILGFDYTVVGIPGASNIHKIKPLLNSIRKFNRIYVCMDNDAAGKKAAQELVAMLPAGKTFQVNIDGVKDVNDLLLGNKETVFKEFIRNATQILPKGIVPKNELIERTRAFQFNKNSKAKVSTGIPSLDKSFGGLSPGRLITVVGDTNIGKSTLVEQMCLQAAEQGVHSFVISLEMPDTEVVTRMLQNRLKLPLYSDPTFSISQFDKAYSDALENIAEYVHFYNHIGVLSVDEIIETMNYAVDVFKVGLIVLDNYTSASESLEWKDLDKLSQRLKNDIALARNVCVLGVSHISRDGFQEGTVPKLKNIRGGVGASQQSDVVIGIGRDKSQPITRIEILKNRLSGQNTGFDLEYKDYRLVESGVTVVEVEENTPPPPQETNENTTNQNEETREQLQEPVGVEDSREDRNPAPPIRTGENSIRERTPLHTGLHAPELYIPRSEGSLVDFRNFKAQRCVETIRARSTTLNLDPLWYKKYENKELAQEE
jgi:twinkle protein